jgi:ABC-type branched-subunit amino acid transport system substrate-binding protein
MRARAITIFMTLAVLGAACANSGSTGSKQPSTSSTGGSGASTPSGRFPAVDQPGVGPTEIRVSGVAAVTNPTANRYDTSFDGVQAYFDMINSQGGIYGRRLVLGSRRDDRLANNRREVQAIIDEDRPFAVLPVTTVLFTGSDLLARANIPTFGWNIQDEWAGPSNFFPEVGALCIGGSCPPSMLLPWVASKLHRTRVGVLAYSVAQSANCSDGIRTSFAKYPSAKIVFLDKSLSFGVTDLSTDVKQMIDANVDFVTTCMDSNGVLTLAKEMRQQGLNAIHYLPNAYEHDFMDKNGGFFEGSIVTVLVAPYETRPLFPPLREYVTWMDRRGSQKTENAEVGWVNAAQFVDGLRGAGPQFTRQKVIDAINRETAFDAGGLIPPINWTKQHTEKAYPPFCGAFLMIHDSKFVPQFGPPGKPFTCFESRPPTLAEAKPVFMQ